MNNYLAPNMSLAFVEYTFTPKLEARNLGAILIAAREEQAPAGEGAIAA